MIKRIVLVAALTFILWPTQGFARCDCTKIQGDCTASVVPDHQHSTISVTASAPKCARVIVDVDNTPYSVLVSGGRAIENVMTFRKGAKFATTVRECKVCKDEDSGASVGPDQPSRFDEAEKQAFLDKFLQCKKNFPLNCEFCPFSKRDECFASNMACGDAHIAAFNGCMNYPSAHRVVSPDGSHGIAYGAPWLP